MPIYYMRFEIQLHTIFYRIIYRYRTASAEVDIHQHTTIISFAPRLKKPISKQFYIHKLYKHWRVTINNRFPAVFIFCTFGRFWIKFYICIIACSFKMRLILLLLVLVLGFSFNILHSFLYDDIVGFYFSVSSVTRNMKCDSTEGRYTITPHISYPQEIYTVCTVCWIGFLGKIDALVVSHLSDNDMFGGHKT